MAEVDDAPTTANILSRRARRDLEHYRAMASRCRDTAVLRRAQAEASRPTRHPLGLLLAADTADATAARWEALADELAALEQHGSGTGQGSLL